MTVTVAAMFIPVHDPEVVLAPSGQDLDAALERLRASGSGVLQQPASRPWGARGGVDPDPSVDLVRIASV